MCGEKNELSFSALFFSGQNEDSSIMYVSVPPPAWLSEEDMTKIVVNSEGMYCLFFLISAKPGGGAYLSVNGREILGSYSEERNGAISGSAVCSIRPKALPCALGITAEGETAGGILIVAKCEI